MRRSSIVLAAVLPLLLLWGCARRAVRDDSPGTDGGDDAVYQSTLDVENREEQRRGITGGGVESSTGDSTDTGGDSGLREAGPLNIDEAVETRSIYVAIEELEDCYRTKNYNKWLSLLTPGYRHYFNDPALLDAEGWDAENLNEFFLLLVKTRRRSNIGDLEISRVEFVSDNKAFVYVLLEGEEFPVPQHTFIRIDNTWLKGLSDEGA
jgi:hypothetical protein